MDLALPHEVEHRQPLHVRRNIITLLHLFIDESEGLRELLALLVAAVAFSIFRRCTLATWLIRCAPIVVIDDFAEDVLKMLEHEYAGSPNTDIGWPSPEHALERLQVHRVLHDCAPRRSL